LRCIFGLSLREMSHDVVPGVYEVDSTNYTFIVLGYKAEVEIYHKCSGPLEDLDDISRRGRMRPVELHPVANNELFCNGFFNMLHSDMVLSLAVMTCIWFNWKLQTKWHKGARWIP
jgi:hypothetical protein